jgi:hypothetical protein
MAGEVARSEKHGDESEEECERRQQGECDQPIGQVVLRLPSNESRDDREEADSEHAPAPERGSNAGCDQDGECDIYAQAHAPRSKQTSPPDCRNGRRAVALGASSKRIGESGQESPEATLLLRLGGCSPCEPHPQAHDYPGLLSAHPVERRLPPGRPPALPLWTKSESVSSRPRGKLASLLAIEEDPNALDLAVSKVVDVRGWVAGGRFRFPDREPAVCDTAGSPGRVHAGCSCTSSVQQLR